MTGLTNKEWERFSAKFLMGDGCWEWIALRDHAGYGKFRRQGRHGKCAMAHRVSYEEFVGPIPDGLKIDHLCRNRSCIRPSHLEPVTQLENVRRGAGYGGALRVRKSHCPYGHEYTEENSGWTGNVRWCRICKRRRSAATKAKQAIVGELPDGWMEKEMDNG